MIISITVRMTTTTTIMMVCGGNPSENDKQTVQQYIKIE